MHESYGGIIFSVAQEPPFTIYTDKTKACRDYVWYSSENLNANTALQVRGVLAQVLAEKSESRSLPPGRVKHALHCIAASLRSRDVTHQGLALRSAFGIGSCNALPHMLSAVSQMPDEAYLKPFTGLPNTSYPSDHLALVVGFRFKKTDAFTTGLPWNKVATDGEAAAAAAEEEDEEAKARSLAI